MNEDLKKVFKYILLCIITLIVITLLTSFVKGVLINPFEILLSSLNDLNKTGHRVLFIGYLILMCLSIYGKYLGINERLSSDEETGYEILKWVSLVISLICYTVFIY